MHERQGGPATLPDEVAKKFNDHEKWLMKDGYAYHVQFFDETYTDWTCIDKNLFIESSLKE